MKNRLMVILLASVLLALAGCVRSGNRSESTAEPRAAVPTTTAASTAPPGTTPSGTRAPAMTAPPRSGEAPTVHVALYARPGEVPPGRVDRIDTAAWMASGAGWHPGDVDLLVHSPGTSAPVLTTKVPADASGAWHQTFLLGRVQPAPYVAVASQDSLHAEAQFVQPPAGPVEEVVGTGRIGAVAWSLTASREANGLVCARLSFGTQDEGRVCYTPSEQDANGDDTLRYGLTADSDAFVVAIGPAVEQVRVAMKSGEVVEATTTTASFTSLRFVAVRLPRPPVIRTVAALGPENRVMTSFVLNA